MLDGSRRSNGRADSFMALLAPIQEPLLAFARCTLGNSEDGEDALQSALVALFEGFDQYVEGTSFRALAFTYVGLHVRNSKRGRSRNPARLDETHEGQEAPDVVAQLEQETAYEAVLREPANVLAGVSDSLASALGGLTNGEHDAFLLRAIGGLTYREISTNQAIPTGTAMNRVRQARMKLRRTLAGFALERGKRPRGSGGTHDEVQ